tara:strand:+ start:237 stop:458 length:222 start_codon:yes stop_codon:yes gene_type:complete
MDKRHRDNNDEKIEAQGRTIDQLTDANHYLLEQNQRLLMTIQLMRTQSAASRQEVPDKTSDLSAEVSETQLKF